MADNITEATLLPFFNQMDVTINEADALNKYGLDHRTIDGEWIAFASHDGWLDSEFENQALDVIQGILRRLQAKYPDDSDYDCAIIEGCHRSSKMRPGEMGGFAIFITPESIEYVNTTQWIKKKQSELKSEPLQTFAEVKWTVGDLMTVSNLNSIDAEEWLKNNQNKIRDRLVELGWGVLEALLDPEDLLKEEEKNHNG